MAKKVTTKKTRRPARPRSSERWLWVECLRKVNVDIDANNVDDMKQLLDEIKTAREMLEQFAREKMRRCVARKLVDDRVRIVFSSRTPRTGVRYRTYRPQGPRGPAVRIAFVVKR